jgi:hypothetical protein
MSRLVNAESGKMRDRYFGIEYFEEGDVAMFLHINICFEV